MRWEDVDLSSPNRASIRVHPSADTRTRTVVSTTKTGEERTIGVGPRTVAILKAHLQRIRHERMSAGPDRWPDPGLVFPNTVGKIRRRDIVVRSLKRFLEEAGLPREVRFYDLRHTAAIQAIHQGVPIHTVSKMLGHSDPAMTLRRYAHVLDEMLDDAAKVMDDLF